MTTSQASKTAPEREFGDHGPQCTECGHFHTHGPCDLSPDDCQCPERWEPPTGWAFPADVFDIFATRDDFLGFGYIGERRHFMTSRWDIQRVREADEAILAMAANLGWDEDRLFTWANSKDGRWFADEALGCGSLARALGRYVR